MLAIGATTVKLQAAPSPTAGTTNPARSDGALSCAVLVIEIPGYATRAVAEQLLCKQRLSGHVAVALEGIATNQRIVLDTGAGIAITFLERPLSALDVLRALLANLARGGEPQDGMTLHGALNLGPIRVVAESDAHVNILGDGISVAQRLLAFAKPDQILVAKTYVEAALAQDTALASLFVYQGSRTDAQVRDHEVFELDGSALASPSITPLGASAGAPDVSAAARPTSKSRSFALAFAGLSVITLTAMVVHILEREIPAIQLASAPAARPLRVVTTPLRAVSRVEPVASRAIESASTQGDRLSGTAETAAASAQAALSPAAPVAAQASMATHAPISTQAPITPSAPAATHAAAATPTQSTKVKPVAIRTVTAARAAQRPTSAVAGAHGSAPAPTQAVAAATPSRRDNTPLAAWQPVESSALPSASMPAQSGTPTAAASALVTLAISPWGEIFVDGRSMGVSPPLREFELAVGKHRVVVRNGDFKAFEQELDLTSHQTVKIKHKFAQRS